MSGFRRSAELPSRSFDYLTARRLNSPSPIRLDTSRLREEFVEDKERITHNCGLAAFYFFDEETAGSLGHLAGPMGYVNHRGQEGIGAASVDFDGIVDSFKASGTVEENRDTFQDRTQHVRIAIGHCRYSTSGDLNAWQPFCHPKLLTEHNGNLTNPKNLYRFIPERLHKKITSDTHALHFALLHAPGETFVDRMREVLPQAEGAYSLILIDPINADLYLVCDPRGFRPLHYGKLKDGSGYMAASETYAFTDRVDPEDIQAVQPGQCVKINKDGVSFIDLNLPKKDPKHCLFELKYIAFPKSTVFNVHVSEYRFRCGQKLAEIDIAKGIVPDVVVGVKDSGTRFAEGYIAKIVEHLFDELVKHPEQTERIQAHLQKLLSSSILIRTKTKRSFIMHNGREKVVSEKFVLDEEYVKGQVTADTPNPEGAQIFYIDDSAVHGRTSRILAQKSFRAGASEVHLRSGAPPVRHLCPYGVDFMGGALIADGKNEEQMAEILGINSLSFMALQDSLKIAYELGATPGSFCHACFSGEYPTPMNTEEMIMKPATDAT